MKEILSDVIKRLRNGEYKNEEHVRLSLVCRILEYLGWDIWNPREVFSEFAAIPQEDASRVDIALFMPPQLLRPAVFIEVKAVGKLAATIQSAELQLRNYNRNNQADISILTDGQIWHFYLSSASGEFSDKCLRNLIYVQVIFLLMILNWNFILFSQKKQSNLVKLLKRHEYI